MFNYIWAGLIIVSFLFAIGSDLYDSAINRFGNGVPIEVRLEQDPASSVMSNVVLRASDDAFRHRFPLVPAGTERVMKGRVVGEVNDPREIELTDASLPVPLPAIREHFGQSDGKVLAGRLARREGAAPGVYELSFEPVRLVKLGAITRAAVTFAQRAFEVAISLVGGLCLWLGLLKIAEDAGLVSVLVRLVNPLLRPLFPGVPKDHPALALISLNVAANMLALGNAATPMGIKAMTELQKLNPTRDTATNAMVMLLAINTAGVTLLPSPTLVALMGIRINALMVPIWLATAISLGIAIATCFLLGRLQIYRRSDPGTLAADQTQMNADGNAG